jgi:hypothetical protein
VRRTLAVNAKGCHVIKRQETANHTEEIVRRANAWAGALEALTEAQEAGADTEGLNDKVREALANLYAAIIEGRHAPIG